MKGQKKGRNTGLHGNKKIKEFEIEYEEDCWYAHVREPSKTPNPLTLDLVLPHILQYPASLPELTCFLNNLMNLPFLIY